MITLIAALMIGGAFDDGRVELTRDYEVEYFLWLNGGY